MGLRTAGCGYCSAPATALPPPPIKLNAAQRRLGSVLLDYVPVRPTRSI